MIYTISLFDHIIEMNAGRDRKFSPIIRLARWLVQFSPFVWVVSCFEFMVGFIIALPIPILRHYILKSITYLPGSPYFYGNYIRAVYWKKRLKKMGHNVLIEQGVVFRSPEETELDDFVLLDKNVLFEAKTMKIGKRVHIAENCCISGGGEFVMEDYSCMAHSSAVVTASDTPADGYRGSGPMVPWSQRKVTIGSVIVRKDAFIGMGARILNNVEIGQGAVIASAALVRKNVAPWTVVAGVPAKEVGMREQILFPDPD